MLNLELHITLTPIWRQIHGYQIKFLLLIRLPLHDNEILRRLIFGPRRAWPEQHAPAFSHCSRRERRQNLLIQRFDFRLGWLVDAATELDRCPASRTRELA